MDLLLQVPRFWSRQFLAILVPFTSVLLSVFFFQMIAHAQDLTIEGSVDETPASLKRLSQRANALENRLRELEQRLAESQKKLVVTQRDKTIEYRLELATGIRSESGASREVAISHLRTSINGRPYVYTQSAVIVYPDSPLPLFLGPIEEGIHLAKIQFQAAPVDSRILGSTETPWQTIERTIPIEISADGGSKQTGVVELVERDNKYIIEKKSLSLSQRDELRVWK